VRQRNCVLLTSFSSLGGMNTHRDAGGSLCLPPFPSPLSYLKVETVRSQSTMTVVSGEVETGWPWLTWEWKKKAALIEGFDTRRRNRPIRARPQAASFRLLSPQQPQEREVRHIYITSRRLEEAVDLFQVTTQWRIFFLGFGSHERLPWCRGRDYRYRSLLAKGMRSCVAQGVGA